MDSRAHVCSEVFTSFGWLPVSKRVDQLILNHVFKVKSGQFPDYMVEHFIPASSNTHMELDLGKRFFSIPTVKSFGKKPYNGCVYGSSSLVILGAYRDIQILKWLLKSFF